MSAADSDLHRLEADLKAVICSALAPPKPVLHRDLAGDGDSDSRNGPCHQLVQPVRPVPEAALAGVCNGPVSITDIVTGVGRVAAAASESWEPGPGQSAGTLPGVHLPTLNGLGGPGPHSDRDWQPGRLGADSERHGTVTGTVA